VSASHWSTRSGNVQATADAVLLSIKTVFPKPGGKVWYEGEREVHRQIFDGVESVNYAFMGQTRMRRITAG
jgi:hypothetical protein